MSRAELIASLAGFPDRLASAARTAAGRPVPEGEWSPDEVVRHLIAVETDVHQARLADLAAHDAPIWAWAEPGPWPGEPELSLEALLDRFAVLRAATRATLDPLDTAGWARTGTHTRLGVWDVEALVRNAVDHDAEHLRGLA